MRLIALDSETHRIKEGMLTPKLACVSWYDEIGGSVLNPPMGLACFRRYVQIPEVILVGQNIAYDLGVFCAEDPSLLPLVFRAYDEGRIADTKVRQQLIDIANGDLKFRWIHKPDGSVERTKTKQGLADLVALYFNRHLKKHDTYRLRYHELDGLPIDQWPREAVEYAAEDAKSTYEVYLEQQRLHGEIANEREQTKAAWALHLMSVWGVRTDAELTAALRADLEKQRHGLLEAIAPFGIYRADGTKDMSRVRELVRASRGAFVPLTASGQVSTEKEVLASCEHPALQALAEVSNIDKLLSTYLPVLERGAIAPVCARYNVLVETGRTSCTDPNLQNPPRKGGIREAFIPRPGFLFASCDYDTLELRSLSQICLDFFGQSSMAEALRRGEDLHLNLAAQILGISPEEAVARKKETLIKEQRQLSKIGNFGFPGGMAPKTFVEYAAGYGATISESQAQKLYDAWLIAWPEMKLYFQRIQSLTGVGDGRVTQVRSGRVRGGVSFCSCANGFFQGLAADGAKEALYAVAKEAYTDRDSALYGSRPVIFLHDEIIAEVPEARASDAADRLGQVMRDSMQKWIPDVPITCSPVLMRRWWKGAEGLRVDGKLVPVRPEKDGENVVWKEDLG